MSEAKTCHECGITFYGRHNRRYCSITCRFWAQFDKSGGPESCWLWKGTVNKATGYGIVGDVLGGGQRTMAHRHAYRLHTGTDPGEQLVLHGCDTKLCGNPAHLRAGTAHDNWMDAVERNRQTYVLPGEANGAAKLTEAQVRAIRRSDSYPKDLVGKYPVKAGTIRAIQRGRTWPHVIVDDAQVARRQYSLELS